MDHLRVATDVALNVARGVSSDAQELREELARLEREWQDVAHGWQGSAAGAYAVLWEQWHDGAIKVVQAVAESAEALSHAAVLYTRQDADSAHLLDSSSSALTAE